MKIMCVVGSRRKKGNTSILTQEVLKPFEAQGVENELIFLGDYDIAGCSGCEGCRDSYKCLINDDMQKLYPALIKADALILGSPTYFYNISADMKAFIDRCYCLEVFDESDRSVWMGISEALGGKYAAVIAVCEQDNEEDMGFTVEAMVKPLEALGYRIVSVVKALHAFAEGDVSKNDRAMKEAEQAGEKLLKTLRLREKIKNSIGKTFPGMTQGEKNLQ